MAEVIDVTFNRYAKLLKRVITIIVTLFILLVLLFASTYTVGEGEQVVLSQFGVIKEIVVSPDNKFVEKNTDLMTGPDSELKGVKITYGKGLRFKIPFITKVDKYDSRLLTYVSDPEKVNTLEKKQYMITIYAQWRIANPGLFALEQKDIKRASIYLDSLIYPAIVQNINQLDENSFISGKETLSKALAQGLADLNQKVRGSGIEIQDIQVHRTILPAANLQSTYERMIANRAKVAQQLRSEGQEEYQKAVADADREARIIEAEAVKEAERIKGEGDAQAMEIYARAYSKDEDFYVYWRSLKALEKAIDENTVLILDKNSPLWKDILDWISIEP